MVKNGPTDSVNTWVVYPERSDKAPVVLVIHDNRGITEWSRSVADQLAADGFIGIAVDLLTMRRKGNFNSTWAVDSVRAVLGSLTPDEINRSLDAVAKYAMALPAALPKYGVIGFCWGGQRSFQHAAAAPTLGAAVVYYGSPATAEQMAAIRAPVLGHYGGNDARINMTIPATDSTMKRLGKSYEFHIHEGAGHGFLSGQEGANGANAAASRAAWPRTIAFLREKLAQ
jgi:carboxymethylenebutenolidase